MSSDQLRPHKPPRVHTTPRRRDRIVETSALGRTAQQIADEEGIPKTTVYSIRRRFSRQDWGVSPAGRGRPRKLSRDDLRHIKSVIEDAPFFPSQKLQRIHVPHVSIDTIRRELQRVNKMHTLALGRPFLPDEAAAKRLLFAQKHINKPL